MVRTLSGASRDAEAPQKIFCRFGTIAADPRRMSTVEPRTKVLGLQASRDPRRSSLFHWLMKKHDALAPMLAGRCVDWKPVIIAAAQAGVTDHAGGLPTEHTVRRTWRNVRKVAEAAQAVRAARPPRKAQPRDLPADWRPTPVGTTSERPVATGLPALSGKAGTPVPATASRPTRVRVVGQDSFGVITRGPLTPEPDYTGMSDVQRKIAEATWQMALRDPG